MIRPLTCICICLAAGSGLYLYQTKHRAQMLDREITRTYKQIETTKERIAALKGEWAGLNETDRLAELAQQHLTLTPLDPKQFTTMADLASRLPAPLPPGTPQPAEVPSPPPPIAALDTPVIAAVPSPAPAIPTPAIPTPAIPATVLAGATPAARPTPARPATHLAAAAPAASHTVSAPPAATHPTVAATPETAPRFLAPVVNVSASGIAPPQPIHQAVAQSIIMPASAPGIGESVARAAQARAISERAIADRAAQAHAAVAPTIQARVAPLPTAPTRTTIAANAPPPAIGSALGGLRGTALPAPVPFGTIANR